MQYLNIRKISLPIVQISAALGPAECELAVKYTLQEMQKQAKSKKIELEMIEAFATQYGYSSLLLNISDDAEIWLSSWLGTIQWTFQSPIRPNHKRKNWFVGITKFDLPKQLPNDDSIIFHHIVKIIT